MDDDTDNDCDADADVFVALAADEAECRAESAPFVSFFEAASFFSFRVRVIIVGAGWLVGWLRGGRIEILLG